MDLEWNSNNNQIEGFCPPITINIDTRPMDAMDGERSAGDLGFHFWKNIFL
jgi:hypothetical protein